MSPPTKDFQNFYLGRRQRILVEQREARGKQEDGEVDCGMLIPQTVLRLYPAKSMKFIDFGDFNVHFW
jgi:hypothetical protein